MRNLHCVAHWAMLLLCLLSRIRSPEAVRSLRWVKFVCSSVEVPVLHDDEFLCFLIVLVKLNRHCGVNA